jgi:hypothetical protein
MKADKRILAVAFLCFFVLVPFRAYGRAGGATGVAIDLTSRGIIFTVIRLIVESISNLFSKGLVRKSAVVDPVWNELELTEHAQSVFMDMQKAWMARD